MASKRAMLFVDGQNLTIGARNHEPKGFQYDVSALVDELCNDYDLVRGYWFDSHKPGELDDKRGFYTFLETNGFRVESVERSGVEGDFKEKEADIRLATELIASAYNDSYEVAVVVTGDKDYLRAVRHVQDRGKIVTVAMFEQGMSGALRREADSYVHLDEIADNIRR